MLSSWDHDLIPGRDQHLEGEGEESRRRRCRCGSSSVGSGMSKEDVGKGRRT